MKKNIITLGEKWYEADPEWWGRRDWSEFHQDQADRRRLDLVAPQPQHSVPTGFGGLHGDGGYAEERARARRALKVDRLLGRQR